MEGLLLFGPNGRRLALQTRRGTDIDNWMSDEPPDDGMYLLSRDLRAKYDNAIHRPTDPTHRYNCHGLTFGARRTGIHKLNEIPKILEEDGYERVLLSDVQVGDIAIYRSQTEIAHSGVVLGTRDGVPWVLSKWGQAHEVLHAVTDCEHRNCSLEYYRICR